MQLIEIYTAKNCFYCKAVKRLLSIRETNFVEYDVTNDVKLRDEMQSRSSGARTVPQIFINKVHIGGCDELYNLDELGDLDKILSKTDGNIKQ